MGKLDLNNSSRIHWNDWNESLTAQDGHLPATQSIRESLEIKYPYRFFNGKECRGTQASCCFWTFAELEVWNEQSSGSRLLAALSQEDRRVCTRLPYIWSQERWSRVWGDGADQGRVEAVEKVQQYATAHGWRGLRGVLRLKQMFEALVQEYHPSS